MRPLNSNSVYYVPDNAPSDIRDLPRYVEVELYKIKKALDILILGHLDKTYVAPPKPRDGDIRYADGTEWNPGSGVGVYYYNGSAWVKLG